MRRTAFLTLLLLTAACQDLSLPQSNVCFSDHVVPLVARDCAACHEGGEYRVKLRGASSDYGRLLGYAVRCQPDQSPLLHWASGMGDHPVIWPRSGDEYGMMAAWIAEGADAGCENPGAGCGGLGLPTANVCFPQHVVPLMARDCASCHSRGEYGIALAGTEADFSEIIRYSLPGSPEQSPFLDWAAGAEEHPVIWTPESAEYATMAAWIGEGTKQECFAGECRVDEDCPEVACVCPNGSFEFGQVCVVTVSTGAGICARDGNCAQPAFGLCPITPRPDVVSPPDVVVPVDVPYPVDVADVGPPEDVSPVDAPDIPDTPIVPDIPILPDIPIEPDIPQAVVSFSSQIVPLLRVDCARCHSRGQWGVRLAGAVSDYAEVMRYVDRRDPEGVDSFLWWSAGGGSHPISWPRGGAKYDLFLQWVRDGAENN